MDIFEKNNWAIGIWEKLKGFFKTHILQWL